MVKRYEMTKMNWGGPEARPRVFPINPVEIDNKKVSMKKEQVVPAIGAFQKGRIAQVAMAGFPGDCSV